MASERELTVENLSEDHRLVLDHPIPKDADAQLLKVARAAAVACKVESEIESPNSPDLKKIEAILTDIRTRLGEPEPKPIPIAPEMEKTLNKLEKSWKTKPHKQRDFDRDR
jgi:hypothetical protein